MKVIVQVFNDELVATKFNRMGIAANAAEPVLEDVAEKMMDIIRQVFATEGRRGGAGWKPLTRDWVRWKYHHGYYTSIGAMTGDLEASLTEDENRNQIKIITGQSLAIGSALPYAAKFNKTRKIGQLTSGDKKEIRQMIQRHLINTWRLTRG